MVFIGASLGISVTTTIAVLGGKVLTYIASEKTLKVISGIVFIVFGIHNIYVYYTSGVPLGTVTKVPPGC